MEVRSPFEVLTVDEVKDYLRIDYKEDDKRLQGYIIAASSYLESAITNFKQTFEKNLEFQEKAKLIACSLIVDWYDNREIIEGKTSDEQRDGMSYTIRSLMTQLQAEA